MKVLITDDDLAVRLALRKVLLEAGHEVLLAADGVEALGHCAQDTVDLLLLDIGLPVKNGWDTFGRITNRNPLLPVIVITGRPNQYCTALAAGVGALMEKPVDVTQLLATMEELAAQSRTARLSRLCGQNPDTRHVPPANEPLLRRLHRC
ncbi:MAG TPA: response regulator [Verrucomicrobiota bacterium]|nr:response regulator [Verrucomicrobiota bacterium]